MTENGNINRHGEIMQCLGRIESGVQHAHLRLDKIDNQIDEMQRWQSNTRGGIKLLAWIAGLGSVGSAILAWMKGVFHIGG